MYSRPQLTFNIDTSISISEYFIPVETKRNEDKFYLSATIVSVISDVMRETI
jgi:hypothetical protein